ncbi:HNH endonuclease signature motif containing protein [Amphritea sp. 2_MG-2023]|uniref:HNH endonuclease n=1 Tax=Amphritea TaxID=515417 RepID=UPI001C070463|nr:MULTISPECIES: HNH endonuclease signature motif containing protein [Amphritea]MBU2965239.1 HNH endonuclease [Amphritea atlantica]MDO6420732.1 HNH endonuclease signature motif containing protein [Amphritea sp. 2_MG-2023]
MAQTLEVVFSGTGEIVQTDIDGDKSLFRSARGESKRFIQKHKLTAGDIIYITKTGERQFTVANKPISRLTLTTVLENFDAAILKALEESPESRKIFLDKTPKKPERKRVETTIFIRNPYVVAEVLDRARGNCERCKSAAPFLRKSDGSPYLEVHHKIPLSEDGDDTVENAVALCPNCHRELHFGNHAYKAVKSELN